MNTARTAFVAACVSALTLMGCGINKDIHKKALDDLAKCRDDLGQSQQDSDAKAQSLSEMQGRLDETLQLKQAADSELASIKSNLQTTESELADLRAQRAAAEKRLAAYRALNDRLRDLVDTGKLKVSYRNGQMVVGLPASILFAGGKSKLSRKGEKALEEVVAILLEFKDRRFMIAGHTDNKKLKGTRFTNWNLSTARAVGIVEFFVAQGFTPENLAAAGYGEFDPIADNSTKDGRAQNRRIEIILVPDLSELPKLAEEPAAPAEG